MIQDLLVVNQLLLVDKIITIFLRSSYRSKAITSICSSVDAIVRRANLMRINFLRQHWVAIALNIKIIWLSLRVFLLLLVILLLLSWLGP